MGTALWPLPSRWLDPAALREAAIERLADACAAHLDLDRIGQLLRPCAPDTA